MRSVTTLVILAGGAVAAAGAALWATGAFALIAHLAAAAQHRFQTDMAGTLRDLKGGAPGAVSALVATCFAYGVVHAAGPGHGKFLLGGYALGSRARLAPLAIVTVAASLAQATAAVVFVYAGVLVFRWTRARMTELADFWLQPLSYTLILLVGLWLALRGLRHLASAREAGAATGHSAEPNEAQDLARGPASTHADVHTPAHAHAHDHGVAGTGHVHGPHCGHAHTPTPDQIAGLAGWRDTAALIGSIAVRPCTGAIFLLILTWNMGLVGAGIAGTYAMGLGTAIVTLVVALASLTMREGALAAMGRSRVVAFGLPILELAAGTAVAAIAGGLLLQSL